MKPFLHGTVIAQGLPEAPVRRDDNLFYGGMLFLILLALVALLWLRRGRTAPRPPDDKNEPPGTQEKP